MDLWNKQGLLFLVQDGIFLLKLAIFKDYMRNRYSGKVKCPCGFKGFISFENAKLMPGANILSSDIMRSVKCKGLY